MSQHQKHKLTQLALAALGIICLKPSYAAYPNVQTMLEAVRPTAAATAPELNAVILAIDALPTTEQKANAYESLTPLADLSLIATSETANRQMIKKLNRRLIKVTAESGFSSGDENDFWEEIFGPEEPQTEEQTSETLTSAPQENADKVDDKYQFAFIEKERSAAAPAVMNKGIWVEVFGSDLNQKTRSEISGYDGDVWGGFLGQDWKLNDHWVLGLAAGFQGGDFDTRRVAEGKFKDKRYQGTLYAYYTCPSSIYALGVLTGAYNQYDNHRHILVPTVQVAHANYHAWEAHAHLELGLQWQKNDLHTNPKVFTNYTHWNTSDYQEHDALGLNLNIHPQDINSFILGAGVSLEYQNRFERAIVIPQAHAYVLHDFSQDPQRSISVMQGGGFDFATDGFDPSGTTFEVGAGLSVHSFKDLIFDVQYDYATRSDYHRHTVGIKLRHEWA